MQYNRARVQTSAPVKSVCLKSRQRKWRLGRMCSSQHSLHSRVSVSQQVYVGERDCSQIFSVINLCVQMRLTLWFSRAESAQRCAMYACVQVIGFVYTVWYKWVFKETVHPEINIVSSFIHPLVNANLWLSFFLWVYFFVFFFAVKVNIELLRLNNDTKSWFTENVKHCKTGYEAHKS